MADIVPTVTASDGRLYRQQLQRVQSFAGRLHIDLMDGIFATPASLEPSEVWWQRGPKVDMHVMYKEPLTIIEQLIRLQPHLIIIHAEADQAEVFLAQADGFGIKLGLALLEDTAVKTIEPYLEIIDHVLIFSGKLGHFGGEANLELLTKVQQLKTLKPALEIGWDGGVNEQNVQDLISGGVDVLNAGGYIQKAADPEKAYAKLEAAITGS